MSWVVSMLYTQPTWEAYEALSLKSRSIFSGMSYIYLILWYVVQLHLKRNAFCTMSIYITLLNSVWVTSLSAISTNTPKIWSSKNGQVVHPRYLQNTLRKTQCLKMMQRNISAKFGSIPENWKVCPPHSPRETLITIERGRHTRPITPIENRRCPKCNVIENEIHFVLECTINWKERLELFDKFRSIDSYYIGLLPENKLFYLMNRKKMKELWNGLQNMFTHPLISNPGGRLNKKDGLTRYGNSHVKDKTS